MNKIFKVVWNSSLGTWTVVSEWAKGKTKSSSSGRKAAAAAIAAVALVSGEVGAVGFLASTQRTGYSGSAESTKVGTNDIVIGAGIGASGTTTNTVGAFTTNTDGSIAAINNGSIVIGQENTYANASKAIAIGSCVSSNTNASVAIGYNISVVNQGDNSTNASSVAIGRNIKAGASKDGNILIGTDVEVSYGDTSKILAGGAIAIGNGAKIIGSSKVGHYDRKNPGNLFVKKQIGSSAMGGDLLGSYNNNETLSIGFGSDAFRNEYSFSQSIAIGRNSNSIRGGVAIGSETGVSAGLAVAVGSMSQVDGIGSVGLGSAVYTGGNSAITIGRQSAAVADFSQAYGMAAWANGTSSMAFGHSATALGHRSIAMGAPDFTFENLNTGSGVTEQLGTQYHDSNTQVNAFDGIAIGTRANTTGHAGTALGAKARSSNNYAAALGYETSASGARSLAAGSVTQATGERSTSLGSMTYAEGRDSTALGSGSSAHSTNSIALGKNAVAGKRSAYTAAEYQNKLAEKQRDLETKSAEVREKEIAFANKYKDYQDFVRQVEEEKKKSSNRTQEHMNAIEKSHAATFEAKKKELATSRTALDNARKAYDSDLLAFNTFQKNSFTLNDDAIAIGTGAMASGNKSISIGYGNVVLGDRSTAIGDPSYIGKNATDIKILGNNNGASEQNPITGNNHTIVGHRNQITDGAKNHIMGSDNTVTGKNDVFVVGNNVVNTENNSVFLGSGSAYNAKVAGKTDGNGTVTEVVEVNGMQYGKGHGSTNGFAGKGGKGVVSVGAPGKERRIQNMAAGLIAENSTDAINGSQLWHVMKKIQPNAGGGTAGSFKLSNATQGVNPITVTPSADQNAQPTLTFKGEDGTKVELTGNESAPVVTVKADKTTLTVHNNGNVTAPNNTDAKKLVDAGTLANTLNNMGFRASVGKVDGKGTNNQTDATALVKAGDEVKFVAADGMNIDKNGKTFTYSINVDNKTTKIENGKLIAVPVVVEPKANSGITVETTEEDGVKKYTIGYNGQTNPQPAAAGSFLVSDGTNNKTVTPSASGDKPTIKFQGQDGATVEVSGTDTAPVVTVKANTTTLTVNNDTGVVEAPAAGSEDGKKVVNASNLANTINNVFWKANTKTEEAQVTSDAKEAGTKVKAGETLSFIAGKNLVVNQNEKDIKFGLASDINVNSVKLGDKDTGPTINAAGSNLNVGGAKITNVGAGTEDGDAVNLKQLKDNRTAVIPGATTSVIESDMNGGGKNYKVEVKKAEFNDVPNSGNNAGKPSLVSNDGADNKFVDAASLNTTLNNMGFNVIADKVDTGTNEGGNNVKTLVKAGDTVTFKAGKGINIAQDGQNFTISKKPTIINPGENITVTGDDENGFTISAKPADVKLNNGSNVNIVKEANGSFTINANVPPGTPATDRYKTKFKVGDQEEIVQASSQDSTAPTVEFKSGTPNDLDVSFNSNNGSPQISYSVKTATAGDVDHHTADGQVNRAAQPDKIVRAQGVADMINNSFWRVHTEAGTGELGANSEEEPAKVKPGNLVKFVADKNIKLTQEDSNIKIATKDHINVDSVTLGQNGPKISNEGGNIKLGDGTNPTIKITNLAPATEGTDAVNLNQLKANHVTVVNGVGTTAAASDNSTSGGKDYAVNINKAEFSPVSASDNNAGKPVLNTDNLSNGGENQFVDAKNLNTTLNNLGFFVNSDKEGSGTNDRGTPEKKLVNFGNEVKFVAGDNINIAQEGHTFKISAKLPNNPNNPAPAGGSFAVAASPTGAAQTITPSDQIPTLVIKGADDQPIGTTVSNVDGKPTVTINVNTATVPTVGGGKVTNIPAAGSEEGNKLVNANVLAETINKMGFKVNAGNFGTGTVSGNSETEVAVGDTVTFRAGDGLALKQDGQTFTFALSGKAAANPLDKHIFKVTGDEGTGTVYSADSDHEDEAPTVSVKGGNHVTTTVNANNNSPDVIVSVKTAEKSLTPVAAGNYDVTKIGNDTGKTPDQITTLKNVAEMINNSGWNVHTKANKAEGGVLTTGSAANPKLIQPGNKLEFVAGSNMELHQAGGAVPAITIRTQKDVKFDSVTFNNEGGDSPKITNDNGDLKVGGGANGAEPVRITNVKGHFDPVNKETTSVELPKKYEANDDPNRNNVSTIGDVLNSGWNLQNNGEAKDFVSPFDTVNFKDTASARIKIDTVAGENATTTINHITVETPLKYVDDGTNTVGDQFNTTNKVSLVGKEPGDKVVLTNVGSELKNYADNPATAKNNIVNLSEGDKAHNALTVADAAKMGWIVSSNLTTGADVGATENTRYEKEVTNAKEVKFIGTGIAKVSGKTDGEVRTITVHVDESALPQQPVVYTNKEGDKVVKKGDQFYKVDPKTGKADETQPVDAANVIASMNSGDNSTTAPTNLVNVKGNLTPTYNEGDKQEGTDGKLGDTAADAVTKTQAAPADVKSIYNNAATVGDVLNAGWNLQANDTAVDFVKPYDTVNFVNGQGTLVEAASTDGKTSTIKINTPMKYVSDTDPKVDSPDTATNTVSMVGGNQSAPVTITNVAAGTKTYEGTDSKKDKLADLPNSTDTNVLTVADAKKLGWIVNAKGNNYSEQVLNANEVEFVGEGATVTGKTEDNKRIITIKVDPAKQAQQPVVYVDEDGNQVVKGDDGKFYAPDVVKGSDNKYYPAGTTFNDQGQPNNNAAPVEGKEPNTVTASMNDGNNSTTNPTQLGNVKGNLKQVSASGDVFNPADNTTVAGDTNVHKQAPNTADEIKALRDGDKTKHNAATLGDVLNSGWNLQGNGEAKDFVRHGDNVNFINGDGTTVEVGSDGVNSTIKINTIVAYTDAAGNKVVKDGDKYYNVDPNTGKADTTKPVDQPKISIINNDGSTTNPIQLGNVAKGANTYGDKLAGDTHLVNVGGKLYNAADIVNGAPKADAQEVTNGTEPTKAADIAKAGLADLKNSNQNNVMTVADAANMGWIVSSDRTTGDDEGEATVQDYAEKVQNANEVRFVGTGDALVSAKTVDGVRTVTVHVEPVDLPQQPVVYTDAEGNKVVKGDDGKFYPVGSIKGPDNKYYPSNTVWDPVTGQASEEALDGKKPDTIIASMNSGGDQTNVPTQLANVKGNLAPTYNKDDKTEGDDGKLGDALAAEPTKEQKSPFASNVQNGDVAKIYNNAATVGDVLNAGWNLKNNGQAVDFVKPYDAVDFINGTGSTVVVKPSDDGKSNTVRIDTPMAYVDPKTGSTTTQDGKPNAPSNVVSMVGGDTTKPVTITNVGNNLTNYNDAPKTGLVDLSTPAQGEPEVSNNTVATVGNLRDMGWVVSSDKTTVAGGDASTDAYNDQVKNANEVRFVGEGDGIEVSGKTDDKGVRVITIKSKALPSQPGATVENTTLVADGDNVGKVKVGGDNPAAEGNKYVNATQVADAINSAAWKLTADKVDGHELIKAGGSANFKAGSDNLTVARDGNTISYDLSKNINVTEVKIGDTGITLNQDGLKMGDKTISDVKSNLKPTYNEGDHKVAKDGKPTNETAKAGDVTKSQTAPSASDVKNMYNNAATVGDVLNAGWNLQGNGEAVDFVKPYDTVNFVNGKGSVVEASPSADGKTSTIKINTPMEYVDGKGNSSNNPTNTVSMVGDSPVTITNVEAGTKTIGGTNTKKDGLADLPNSTNTNVMTVADAKKMGWVVSASGATYSDQVLNANQVDFVGEGAATVIGETNKTTGVRTIKVKVDAGSIGVNNLKVQDVIGKVNTNPTGNVSTPDGTKIATTGDVANAINNSGWTIKGAPNAGDEGKIPEGSATGLVKPSGVVVYSGGKGTTAKVAIDKKDGDYKVSFDINQAKGAKVDQGTATVIDNTTGKPKTGDDLKNTYLDAADTINLINNTSYSMNTGKGDQGFFKTGATKPSEVKAGSKVNYLAGKNMEVKHDGQGNVTYATSADVEFDKVNVNKGLNVKPGATVNMGGNKITNVAAGTDDTDAVNYGQLKNLKINGVKTYVQAGRGVTVTGDGLQNNPYTVSVDQSIIDGANKGHTAVQNVLPGSPNVQTSRSGDTIYVSVSENPVFQNTTAQTIIVPNSDPNRQPIIINDGSITGINPGRIAPDSFDAVNGAQLHAVMGDIKGLRGGIAAAMATAGLPQVYLPGKSLIAGGVSTYRGQTGFALGMSSISDGGNWIIKGTVSGAKNAGVGASAAIGYQW